MAHKKNLFRKTDYIYIFLLIVISLLTTSQTATFGFVWDDNDFFIKHSYFNSGWGCMFDVFNPLRPNQPIYTPLTSFIYFIFFKIFNASSMPYHIINIIIYTLTCILIYKFYHFTIKNNGIAFVGAAIFTVLPVHTEVFSWICANGYLLCGLFLMAALNIFIVMLSKKSRVFYLTLFFFFYIAALLSQPAASLLPLLLLLYGYCFAWRRFNFTLKLSIPMFILSGTIFVLSKIAVVPLRFTNPEPLELITKITLFAVNVSKLFIPWNLSPLHPSSQNLHYPQAFSLYGIFFLILFASLFFIANNKIYRFTLLWIFVCLLPYSHLLFNSPITTADRYLYFASVAASLLTACILFKLSFYGNYILLNKKRIFILVSLLTIIFYAFTTHSYSNIWKNNLSLWKHAVIKYPCDDTINLNYAYSLAENDKNEESLYYYKQGMKINPLASRSYNGIVKVLQKMHRYEESLPYSVKAVKISPDDWKVHQLLVKAYFMTGAYDKANREALITSEKTANQNLTPEEKIQVYQTLSLTSYYNANIDRFVKYASAYMNLLPILPSEIKQGLNFHEQKKYKKASEFYILYLKSSNQETPDIERLLHAAQLSETYGEKADTVLFSTIQSIKGATEQIYRKNSAKASDLLENAQKKDPYSPEIKFMRKRL